MRRRSKTAQRGRSLEHQTDDLEQSLASPLRPLPPVDLPRPPVRIRGLEDRRRWAPGGFGKQPREAPREAIGRSARVVHKMATSKVVKRPDGKPLQARRSLRRDAVNWIDRTVPAFQDVRKTIICLKRKMRRQVLFAKRQTGKGARSPKHYSEWSDVECS